MAAALLELQARTRDQVAHGARDEHLVGIRQGADPRRDVNRHPADVVAHHLTLAGVKAGASRDAKCPGGSDDRLRAADAPGRTVEGGEEAVAQRLHLLPSETRERLPGCATERLEDLAPAAIA